LKQASFAGGGLIYSKIDRLTWIYCPGHAGVQRNEQADRLAGRAPIEGVLKWDKSDLLMAVRDVSNREDTLACENDPHIILLKERGVKQGEVKNSTQGGRYRIVHNQVDTGTISIHTLIWLLERVEDRIWECPDCCDATPDNS
jgi:hypothetical protein